MVTVVGIEVTGDDVLEVSVLPVQVAGLDGAREHSPVGTHLCRGRRQFELKHLQNYFKICLFMPLCIYQFLGRMSKFS